MRKTYIDNIRWMTVVLVVLYHVLYMFNGVGIGGAIGPLAAVQAQDACLYVVYPWFMLLLFVISGMSARFYLNQHAEREFLRSRTTKLLVPSTIGLFVFFWIAGYYNMRIGGAFESMSAVPKPVLFAIMAFSGIGPLWYIQMLWVFSLLLLVLRRIGMDRLCGLCEKASLPVLLCLTPVIWGAAQILNAPVIVVYRFGIYGAGFFLGYLVLSHDAVMDRLERGGLPLSLAALGLGIGFVTVFWGEPYAEHRVLDTFLCSAYAWIATLAVLAVMKKWGNSESAFSRLMCRKAWGLYLFHYLPLAACAWYLHRCTTLPPMAMYLLVGAAAFAGALVLYEIIRRIPVLRWCICGIGGGK